MACSCWLHCSCWDCRDDYNRDPYYDKRHKRKQLASSDKHIPNKNEAKLLRNLMSKHKMSEEEIRSHKKFRILLSKEQNNNKKSITEKEHKIMLKLLKRVTQKTKLAKEHPKTIDGLLEEIFLILDKKSLTYNSYFTLLKEYDWEIWIETNLGKIK